MAFTDHPPLRWRIRVYEPDGVLRGQLPVPLSWQAAFPFSDLSSMTLDYLNKAPGIAILDAPCEVVLELSAEGGTYTEYPNSRFINIRQTQDLIQADVTTKLTMPSYGWMLRKVRNINEPTFNDEGNRHFADVSVGSIVNTFINEAHTRGNIPFLVTDFSATQDSNGVNWNNPLTLDIAAGQDLYTFLTAMSEQGMCDWRMNGRTLQMYVVDTELARDLTTNPTAVVLHTHRDIITAPDDVSWEDIAQTVMLAGEDQHYVTLEQEDNPAPWGNWESFITQSGVSIEILMTAMATRYLEMANAPRTQMTRELMFRDSSPLPIIDYRTGDYIYANDSSGTVDMLRVRQLTLDMKAEGVTGNVVLGDKFTERDIRLQRQINALAGTGIKFGGTGGTTTPVPPKDTRVPAQVTGLVLSSDSIMDPFGNPVGLIGATWSPVTLSTGGDAQEMASYIVRYAPFGTTNYRYQTVAGDTTSTTLGTGVTVDTTFTVSVAAIGTNNLQGAYSSLLDIFVGSDEIAPPVPSDPVLSTRLGTIRVHWDGRDEDNLNMPADFRRIEVEMGNSASGPFSYIDLIQTSAGDIIVADQPYNVQRWFRFRAVDASGNVSAYSGTANIATQPLIDTDVIGEVISGANIVDGSIVASDKIFANSITAGQIAALTITAGQMAANSITADKIAVGAVTAEKILAYSIDATRLAIGGNRNLITDSNAADSALGAIRVNNAQGAPNSAGAIVWSHQSNEFYRSVLSNDVASAFGRLGWFTSSLIDPDLTSGTGTVNPLYVYPVDRLMGGLHGKFSYNISLTSGTWPAGAVVQPTLYARWVKKDGSLTTLSILADAGNKTAVTGGWVTFNGTSPVTIPVDAVGVIPYLRLAYTNATTAIVVDHSNVFVGQVNGGVLIEDGAITANKIVANAITTEKLQADAITAKHTITGALFQTATSGQRVTIGPNANYVGQAGIRLDSGLSGDRDTNIFTAGNTTGGWELGAFGVVGPEATRNSTGRADIDFRVGGGWRIEKRFVADNSVYSSVVGGDTSNELGLNGTLPRGTELGDSLGAIRGFTSPFQNGTITWGYNNGYLYRGSVTPNTTNTTPRYSSISASSSTSLTWQTSAAIDEVNFFLYRGGFLSS